MMRLLAGMPAGVIGVEAEGKLRTEDYTSVLAPAIDRASEQQGKVRIVLVFTAAFEGLEAGAVWQDLKMGVRDWRAWERIALVTDHAWMKQGLQLFAWAVPGEVKAFGSAERDAAIAWAAADS
jgi:hypothetical protein